MIKLECRSPYADGCTEHEFPDDWQVGGAAGTDPRLDSRFRTTVYIYLDRTLHPIHTTVVPLCVQEAIDRFTVVANYGSTFAPVYLQVKRGRESEVKWQYDPETDIAWPL